MGSRKNSSSLIKAEKPPFSDLLINITDFKKWCFTNGGSVKYYGHGKQNYYDFAHLYKEMKYEWFCDWNETSDKN